MASWIEGMEHRLHDIQIGIEAATNMLRPELEGGEIGLLVLDELNRQFREVVIAFEESCSKRAVLKLV